MVLEDYKQEDSIEWECQDYRNNSGSFLLKKRKK